MGRVGSAYDNAMMSPSSTRCSASCWTTGGPVESRLVGQAAGKP